MEMNLSDDDRLALAIAQKIVTTLVRDWQTNPCYWYSEIDIQAELRNRLQSAYSLVGLDWVIWRSSEINDTCPVEQKDKQARVQCEPEWDGRKPDIVVWSEKEKREIKDEEWKALWACEIKYIKGTPESDIEKLKEMLGKDILYGCSLSFQDGEQNLVDEYMGNLRIVEVSALRGGC